MIHVRDWERTEVVKILSTCLQNATVVVFGSRYKGNHKPYSDLDLAIMKADKTILTLKEYGDLKEAFEESDLNFRVDLVDYWRVSQPFRAMIDRACEQIY